MGIEFLFFNNNWLKMHHEPMRRKPFKKRKLTNEAGLVHGVSYCFVEHKEGKSALEAYIKMQKSSMENIQEVI